jgi:hypothetical protein
MVPVFEAEEAMRLRMASLRLASGSASVATSSKQGFGFSVPDGGCADVFCRPPPTPEPCYRLVRCSPPAVSTGAPQGNRRWMPRPSHGSAGFADRMAQLQNACAAEDEGEQDSTDRGR